MLMFAQSKPAFARLVIAIVAISFVARTAAADDESAPLPIDNDPLVHVNEPKSDLRLVEKFAKIVELKNRITTVYGFDPEVVNVTKVDMHPNEIRVHALRRESRRWSSSTKRTNRIRWKSSSSATSATCRPISRTCFPTMP